MGRLICLVIGYVCGLFQTAYIYGKSKGIDIREIDKAIERAKHNRKPTLIEIKTVIGRGSLFL